jgi:putative ABC transport system permease protein
MRARDLLRLVLSNLRRMKARVAMTAIGVAIGTAAVVVLVSLGAGLQRTATEDLGSLGDLTRITVFPARFIRSFGGSGAPGRDEAILNEKALAGFRKLPGVVAATPQEWLAGGATVQLNRLVAFANVIGLDPRQVHGLDMPLASGIDRLGRGQALAGARVAAGFSDPQTGQPVDKPPDLQGQSLQLRLSRVGDDGKPVERVVRLRVVGVLRETGGSNDYDLILSLDDVLEMNAWFTGSRPNPARDGYSQALVKVASTDQVLAVEQEILRQGFFAYSARSTLQQLNVFFLVIQGVLGGIGAIALLVAAFGIANTMTMAIYERTREIGLMKAVGATNRDVMGIFLWEAASIGTLGGLIGVLVGVAVGGLIDLIAGTYLAAMAVQSGASAAEARIALVHTPLWLPVFAIGFAAMIGIVSGVYPALRAAALNPIAALKYE